MNDRWLLDTHGEPLTALQVFLQVVWQRLALDGMIVPLEGPQRSSTSILLLTDPQQLDAINPFKPLMTRSVAAVLPDLLDEYPGRFGVVLRPCEMRALIEMVKHDGFPINRLVTICVDCLGTLPADEYEWRAERKGDRGSLTREALQFARQGGIVPYRYRTACQMCESPQARGADINIGVLGLPVRRFLLVSTADEKIARRCCTETAGVGGQINRMDTQRRQMLGRLQERRDRARYQVRQSLAESMPQNVDDIVHMLSQCGACQACLDACPICAAHFPRQDASGEYQHVDVLRWIMSCAGCGMCEQACPECRPLSAMFGRVRDELAQATGYRPGASYDQPLPIA